VTRVAIIGAGIAGLACAGKLADGGLAPVIFDKGRGIGGRVATRRMGEMRFDHGAQYITARGPDFANVLHALQAQGAAAIWDDGSDQTHIVGVPGMSGLARAMAAGLDVRQLAQVTSVRPSQSGWLVQIGAVADIFDCVVITVPAPQIAGLLGQEHPIITQVADVRLAPCLTLMAAIDIPPIFVTRSDASDPIAWIAQDSSKPGRPQGGATTWVAQASPEFSAQYLEEDAATITDWMLPLLCERLQVTTDKVSYASAHRWRYARVTSALGRPFLRASSTLYAGGDWCIGPRVEAAWISGDAIAQDILGAHL
jgi:renalase